MFLYSLLANLEMISEPCGNDWESLAKSLESNFEMFSFNYISVLLSKRYLKIHT